MSKIEKLKTVYFRSYTKQYNIKRIGTFLVKLITEPEDMIFQFLHFGYLCTAYVIFEPMQVKDTMIVYMLVFNEELGYEIFFIEYEDRKWTTLSNIKIKFPETYESLCNKLNDVFVDYKFQFDGIIPKRKVA